LTLVHNHAGDGHHSQKPSTYIYEKMMLEKLFKIMLKINTNNVSGHFEFSLNYRVGKKTGPV